MPIIIDYPQASLKNALELANAVDALGGRCTTDMAADKLGMKVSGGYKALVGAAVKYNLITSKAGFLETTSIFKDHKLAYSADEAAKILQRCLLNPPVFQKVYERFKGRQLPHGHFDKLLIREFGVSTPLSSRVVKYFVEGSKMCGLLGPGDTLIDIENTNFSSPDNADSNSLENEQLPQSRSPETESQSLEFPTKANELGYTVRIRGPGMDSVVSINEADDLDIVEVMLRKVRRQLGAINGDREE